MAQRSIIFFKLLNLFLLLGTVAWSVCAPGWESIMAAIGSFIAYIGLEIKVLTELSNKDADRKLFDKFLDVLPTCGAIEFIGAHDFGGKFDPKQLDQLRKFIWDWRGPEYEFLDQKLEAKRKRLYNEAKKFMDLIGEYTFRDPYATQGVPKEWEYRKPEHFRKAIESLHTQADLVVEAHKELVREARRRLKV